MILGNTNTGKYIKAIKNANKRNYAQAYYMFCTGFRSEEPTRGELSAMAAAKA